MRSNIENDWLRQDKPSFYTPSGPSGRSLQVLSMRSRRRLIESEPRVPEPETRLAVENFSIICYSPTRCCRQATMLKEFLFGR
jgi:hypothetical protein